MKREHIGNFIAILVAASILIAAWMTSSPGFWPGVFGAIMGPVGAILLIRWMKNFQDERLTQIYVQASRNGFVFLILALPYIGAILAIQSVAFEAVVLIFFVWAVSVAIVYISGVYYYRQ